jgi:hypothetical protein
VQTPQLCERLRRGLLDRVDRSLGLLRAARQGVPCAASLEDDDADRVRQHVVELAGDPGTLVALCGTRALLERRNPRALVRAQPLHPFPQDPGGSKADHEEDHADERVRAPARVSQVVVQCVRPAQHRDRGDQQPAGEGLAPISRVGRRGIDRRQESEPERPWVVVRPGDELECQRAHEVRHQDLEGKPDAPRQ